MTTFALWVGDIYENALARRTLWRLPLIIGLATVGRWLQGRRGQ